MGFGNQTAAEKKQKEKVVKLMQTARAIFRLKIGLINESGKQEIQVPVHGLLLSVIESCRTVAIRSNQQFSRFNACQT